MAGFSLTSGGGTQLCSPALEKRSKTRGRGAPFWIGLQGRAVVALTLTWAMSPAMAGVPGAPTIGTASAGNAQATVNFTAPASDGASGITSYTATSNPGGITAQTTAASAGVLLHMDGSNGGTTFTDSLGHAFSILGGSPVTSTTTYEFGGSSFFAGTSGYIGTGGAADWVFAGDYTMEMWQYVQNTTDVRRIMGQSTWQFHHNGHLYFYDGAGVWHDLGAFPGTNVWYHVAVSRQGANCYGFVNGTLTATWTNSASFGSNSEGLWIGHVNGSVEYAPNMYIDEIRIVNGSAVYTSNFTPPAAPLSPVAKANPITVTGLTNGTAYTFTLTATNAAGTGAASAASNSVTPNPPATAPGAPTIGTATAGNAQARVTFTAPSSNGGRPITGYTVTSSPGGLAAGGSASPITVTGLTDRTAYTFTVTATNAVGTGPASSASNSVTPDIPPTVSISTPSNGATGTPPASFSLTAAATAGISGETISSVQYYANGTAIGPAQTASPYAYSWTDVQDGTYSLTAAARDNYGTVGISAPVTVTVGSAQTVNVYYIYADQIDTPRVITRSSDNQVVWRWDGADPFGAAQPNQNPANLGAFVYNKRFPGQLYDSESGTHYNYFRNYDPAIGSYVQSDPIGLRGGVNTYAYAKSDPARSSDPLGLLIRGGGLTDPTWESIRQAEARIRAEVERSCSCYQSSAGSCAPCKYRDRLLRKLQTVVVTFASGRLCAESVVGGGLITVEPAGLDVSKCQCLATTLYHELLHSIGLSHNDPGDPVTNLEDRCKGPLCGPRGGQ